MLTVIVPVYNVENYIAKCIESIQAQTYKNIEILLIDDGSTDRSGEICDQYAKNDARIKVYHIVNGGASRARNYGLAHANGRFIAFVDADDYLEQDMYEILLDDLQSNQCGMVICGWYVHDLETEKTIEFKVGNDITIKPQVIKSKIMFENKEYGGGYPWNRVVDYQMVKESAGKDILFPEDISVYEDKCWVMESLDYVNNVYLNKASLYHHNRRVGSLSNKPFETKRYERLLAWFYLKQNLVRTGQWEEYNQEIYYEKVTKNLLILWNTDSDVLKVIKEDYMAMKPQNCSLIIKMVRMILLVKFYVYKHQKC